MKRMILLIQQYFCKHSWKTMWYSRGHYDEEIWNQCEKCFKQVELDDDEV